MGQSHKITYQYCRSGHMLYSFDNSIDRKRCQQCGEEYLYNCDHCNSKIPNVYYSRVYFTTSKPISFPNKPGYCIECGEPFPWHEQEVDEPEQTEDFWNLLHPHVFAASKSRFESGHYADAVEASLKALNNAVKRIYQSRTNDEFDGVKLMRKAFSPQNPVIVLDDLGTETGKNIQQGYMELFAGSMAGVRNPKAHDNLEISRERTIHFLFLASLLFFKLDERI